MLIQKNELLDQLKGFYEKYNGRMEDVNIFGIQDESNQDKDVWNDWIGLNIGFEIYLWKGTTNPGKHAMITHPDGAGHMAYGFHDHIWCFDKHAPAIPNWTHEALCQRSTRGCGAIKYWRDVNKHYVFDPAIDKIESSKECYMNFHRASKVQDVAVIGTYSEGCTVTLHAKDFEDVLTKIKLVPSVAKDIKGFLANYLLTNIKDWTDLNI